jgi:hypothetical protein
MLAGCGSITTPAPQTTPAMSPRRPPRRSQPVYVELGRAAGRIGLSIALRQAGVSDATSALIMGELRTIVDSLIAGEGLSVVLDPIRWHDLQAELVERITAAIVHNTAPLLTEMTVRSLVDSLITTFADQIRSRLS